MNCSLRNLIGPAIAASLCSAPLFGGAPAVLALATGPAASVAGGDRELAPVVPPETQGTFRIADSIRIEPGEYPRRTPGHDGVILLEGLHDTTLFLDDATFLGTPTPSELETCVSRGIVLRDCENVRIHGGVLRGYHTAIWAERCRGLMLEGIVIDGTFAQRLRSTVAVESEEDLIAWPAADATTFPAELGAAIRLTNCNDVTIRNCGARHGQNGLLAASSKRIDFYRNDFSFLSGWGVAGLAVDELVAAHNRLDYCMRGFSAGYYASGQNSAAFLLFGDSRNCVFANNSANRAGTSVVLRDLPAVEAPSEPVRGQARNPAANRFSALVWGNDFSGSIAGAIEVERSSDVRILGNLFEDCEPFGILARRPQRLLIGGNTLAGVPGAALALEDPRECVVVRNVLTGSEVGLEVWSASIDREPEEVNPQSMVPLTSEARDLWVSGNSFIGNDADLGLRDVWGLRVRDNVFQGDKHALLVSGLEPAEGVPALLLEGRDPETGEDLPERPEPRYWLRGLGDRMPTGHLWRSTIWHPGSPDHELLSDYAEFRSVEVPGYPLDDIVRSLALADLAIGVWGPWDFESGLDRPTLRRPGGVLSGVSWQASWFRWDSDQDPRGDLERWRAGAQSPLHTAVVSTWATPFGEDERRSLIVGRERLGLVANCRTSLAGGPYRLTVMSDDGVRVFVDGKTVLENWTWHPSVRDTVEFEIEAGWHDFRLEYFQIDGPAALLVDLDRLSPLKSAHTR